MKMGSVVMVEQLHCTDGAQVSGPQHKIILMRSGQVTTGLRGVRQSLSCGFVAVAPKLGVQTFPHESRTPQQRLRGRASSFFRFRFSRLLLSSMEVCSLELNLPAPIVGHQGCAIRYRSLCSSHLSKSAVFQQSSVPKLSVIY